ncbi:ATP-dependent DNA helicase 2 subunit 1 isoform 2 [Galdieria sulphuraria]|uniref:ATP-dependent DNA helicase 2 subunit 1 isoform 2 n=1 Tax=Galdieria sulphuraria TaxID=130081 RepID=M2Y1L3_GALSU|nr:ATP-dependent DNA helicase 2 subunit 1 isoform 2 [Galdieria sulphuraria]EME29813.1 ATP-dependent DNA helicase 2 subunit 1 isoform 2 [Galdieria sulphuraria]|eukprot:XP_005706333.1 ATP-dependent DNA helicase 2 subunit 1 isoform 2 [Galdieria sulphuraria]
MYDENEDKVPLITLALNCIKEIFKSRIISDTGDLLGVVLFGTSKVNNPNDLASIYVLLELDVPDPESILYLETLEKTPQWMMSQLGSLERYAKVKFQELLFTCRSLLNHAVRSKTLNVRKRLLLFTDDDDPIENDENVKNLNIRQARDLSESGMNIELLPLKSSRSKPFDYHLFYEDVIGSSRQELEPVSDPISRFEELQLHILKKKYKKRVLNNTFLYLNGLQNEGAHAELETVGLEVYALFHRPSRSKKVFLEARNNEPVRRVTIAYSEESGALLANANDIRYSFPFAGVACVFTHSEMEELGHLCRYGMELIGFENKNKLKWQYNMRPSYFLYPSGAPKLILFTLYWLTYFLFRSHNQRQSVIDGRFMEANVARKPNSNSPSVLSENFTSETSSISASRREKDRVTPSNRTLRIPFDMVTICGGNSQRMEKTIPKVEQSTFSTMRRGRNECYLQTFYAIL